MCKRWITTRSFLVVEAISNLETFFVLQLLSSELKTCLKIECYFEIHTMHHFPTEWITVRIWQKITTSPIFRAQYQGRKKKKFEKNRKYPNNLVKYQQDMKQNIVRKCSDDIIIHHGRAIHRASKRPWMRCRVSVFLVFKCHAWRNTRSSMIR